MHTLLDLHGNIPTFISITNGKVHDVNVLDEIAPQAGAFYVMDRGYLDFGRLYVFTLSAAFFVVRTKKNVLLQRRYSRGVDKSTLRSDHTVVLTAIIRADGSVNDIAVVKSLYPQLDQNAVQALSRWVFLPALKNGQAIDLEAVITVPFRAKATGF